MFAESCRVIFKTSSAMCLRFYHLSSSMRFQKDENKTWKIKCRFFLQVISWFFQFSRKLYLRIKKKLLWKTEKFLEKILCRFLWWHELDKKEISWHPSCWCFQNKIWRQNTSIYVIFILHIMSFLFLKIDIQRKEKKTLDDKKKTETFTSLNYFCSHLLLKVLWRFSSVTTITKC